MMEDIEIWKSVLGYEGYYEISSQGRVKALLRTLHSGRGSGLQTFKEIIRKQSTDYGGYKRVHLCKEGIKKNIFIHRLVGIHFIDNPNNLPQINHINGIKVDNRVINLEWCTPLQNIRHAMNKGLYPPVRRGDKAAKKLTSLKVKEIRDYISKGFTHKEISKMYNVSRVLITRININNIWI